MTTRKMTKAAGWKKQVRENVAALNELINLRERMTEAMTCMMWFQNDQKKE